MNISFPCLIIAGLISLLTWAVTNKVLKEHSTLSNPLIPACVGGLSFIGLTTMGSDLIHGIALLYAALAIAIFLIFLFGLFTEQHRNNSKHLQKTRSDQSKPSPPSAYDQHNKKQEENHHARIEECSASWLSPHLTKPHRYEEQDHGW